jgi:hypothetical protein
MPLTESVLPPLLDMSKLIPYRTNALSQASAPHPEFGLACTKTESHNFSYGALEKNGLKRRSLLSLEKHTANHVVDQYKTRTKYFNFKQYHLYHLLQYNNALTILIPISVYHKVQW